MAKTRTGDQWILDSYGGHCRYCGQRRTFPFDTVTSAKADPCQNPLCPSNRDTPAPCRAIVAELRALPRFQRLPEDLDDD